MPSTKGAMLLTLILSAIVAISSLAAGAMAIIQPRASWVMFVFEFIILVSAVFGIRIARGKHNDGPATGLVCIAGCIAVAALFGYIGGGRTLFSIDTRPLLVARAGAAAILTALAAWLVLSRDPKTTIRPFIYGCITGLPVPILLIAIWKLRSKLGAMSDVLVMGIAILAFVLITGLLAASVQFLVKAFERGARQDAAPTP